MNDEIYVFHLIAETGLGRNLQLPEPHDNNWDETDSILSAHCNSIMKELRRLLGLRKNQSVFHPNATQFTLHLGTAVFAFWRQSMNRDQSVFCLSNVTPEVQLIKLSDTNLIRTDT